MSEKRDLQAPGGTLPSFQTQNDSRKQRKKIVWSGHRYAAICAVLGIFGVWTLMKGTRCSMFGHGVHEISGPQCVQVDPIVPKLETSPLNQMDALLSSDSFRMDAVSRWSDAVKIPTVVYDDMGVVGEDPRWEIFYEFSAYLEKTYPALHANLKLEKVNTHGLLYTWQGSDLSLKPLVLMAHQDVVPVPESTVDAWTHPPFSGYYDGKHVWGRGAFDCKNQLLAVFEAVELLLQANFTPARTILLSFGFDEEISGYHGAQSLAAAILERYGPDSIAVIVDEGTVTSKPWGLTVAAPGVAEKGYTDVKITVRTPGGHSSIPPDHTSIGIISELISLVEADQYPTHLDEKNPYLGQLRCGAAHSSSFPTELRKLLEKRDDRSTHKSDRLALEAAKAGPEIKYLMQTSVAVDIIDGGIKANALPESVSATLNHRVNVGDHPTNVHAKLGHLAGIVAKKYNLAVHAFDGTTDAPSSISLVASNATLEPAPVTPTDTDRLTPFAVLSGTTRALYGKEMIVAPGIMTGNTDTRHYWSLSRHIFRYCPGYDPEDEGGIKGAHTVDEKMSASNHVSSVKWYSLFIRNVDEADFVA